MTVVGRRLTADDKMGNCFKASSHDDISLLQDSDVPDNNGESHAPNVPPPPPYQVSTVSCWEDFSFRSSTEFRKNYRKRTEINSSIILGIDRRSSRFSAEITRDRSA